MKRYRTVEGLLGALPPDPRSLPHRRPAPAPRGKTGAPRGGPGPLAYSRPPGARVALLRSPILPAAPPRIATSPRAVQPRITPGASPSSGTSDTPRTPDVSNAPKLRTFLLCCDRVG